MNNATIHTNPVRGEALSRAHVTRLFYWAASQAGKSAHHMRGFAHATREGAHHMMLAANGKLRKSKLHAAIASVNAQNPENACVLTLRRFEQKIMIILT